MEQTRRIWVTLSPKSSVIYDDNIDNDDGYDSSDNNNNSNDNNNYDNDTITTNYNDNDDTATNCNDNDNNNNPKRSIIMHILWDIMHLNMFDLDMDK